MINGYCEAAAMGRELCACQCKECEMEENKANERITPEYAWFTRDEIEEIRSHLKTYFPNQSVERSSFNKICDLAVKSLDGCSRCAELERDLAEERQEHRATLLINMKQREHTDTVSELRAAALGMLQAWNKSEREGISVAEMAKARQRVDAAIRAIHIAEKRECKRCDYPHCYCSTNAAPQTPDAARPGADPNQPTSSAVAAPFVECLAVMRGEHSE